MRTYKTEGIVIRRRNYNDADRILTVFTKELGKIHVKAPGVRKITSRRSSHIELLNHSMLTLHRGNGMPVLTEAQTVDSFSAIKSNLDKVGHAYHLCELADGLCPENQENRRVFFLLRNILTFLAEDFIDLHSDVIGFNETPGYQSAHYEYVPQLYASGLADAEPAADLSASIHDFEIELLTTLGYWNKADTQSAQLDTHDFIENILERKLKSKKIFSKLQ